MKEAKNSVQITGMGAITPISVGVKGFSKSLREGLCNFKITELALEHQSFRYPVAKVDSFDLMTSVENLGLPEIIIQKIKRLRNLSRSASYGLYCALEAWSDAELVNSAIDPERIAIVSGGSNIQQGSIHFMQEKYRGKLQFINPNYGLTFFDTDFIGILSEVLGVRGEGFSVASASASGTMAIIQGLRLVSSGDYDIVVVAAPLMELSVFEYQGFTALGAMANATEMDADKICRPFDNKHCGFVYGENAGCLVLESEKYAEARGKKVYATICGYGLSLDGNRNPNPSAEGEAKAMCKAIQVAGIEGGDIDYVNAHGTSSVIGDKTEAEALINSGLANAKVNSTKSLIGHGLSAAGVVEAIASVIQMRDNFLHPNANLENPINDQLCWVGRQSEASKINYTISNSFGFGGTNTSIILKNVNN